VLSRKGYYEMTNSTQIFVETESLSTPAAAFCEMRSRAAVKQLWSLRLHK